MSTLFEIENLDAYYGAAQILEGVGLTMATEGVAVIGRNGMGKTTLCAAVMGMMPRATGLIRFRAARASAGRPTRSRRSGSRTCPRDGGSSLSSSVDEHLRMLARGTRGKRWSPDAVYEFFPRRERKKNGGTQPGRAANAAIARALLGNLIS